VTLIAGDTINFQNDSPFNWLNLHSILFSKELSLD